MSDYTIYKPLVDKLSTKPQTLGHRQFPDCSLAYYTNMLKFYGESAAEDKVVYILLYLSSTNLSSVKRLFAQERSLNPAFVFCKEVLYCISTFSNPFEGEYTMEKLHNSFFDKTDQFITEIKIEDSKRYIRFIVELLWLLLQIRTNFVNGKIVECMLISIIQFNKTETKFNEIRSLY